MKSGSFLSEKNAFIQLTDMDLYTLLKRTDSYITNWEVCMAPSLIANGKQAYEKQQQDWQSQNQGQDQGYAQNGQYTGILSRRFVRAVNRLHGLNAGKPATAESWRLSTATIRHVTAKSCGSLNISWVKRLWISKGFPWLHWNGS